MTFTPLSICGAWLIEPVRYYDARGYFSETFRADLFREATGLDVDFVQENESESVGGTIRGLHFQAGEHAQAKLVRVCEGEIVDVVVDLRRSSPSFGRYIAVPLSHESGRQLFVPRGCAHGFAVLSERARFLYKVDNYWCREAEHTLLYDDPTVGVEWPIAPEARILSPKDLTGSSLAALPLFP
ncbi:MAG: dTDP-4-dehydrorhamnose 3,5-epimerase [Muribaculaceae bacterium]|nr:dTDP-4-dehydrorhamnose 3,5-epimerase [Muribaculaceae bacterium]